MVRIVVAALALCAGLWSLLPLCAARGPEGARLGAAPAFDTAAVHVARYYGGRRAAVTYTFDDGLLEHYTLVFPELRRRGLKATFGVIGSKVGRDMKGTPCLTWAMLREMAADGQEIASHGWGHLNVTKLSPEALAVEIGRNDSIMADSVGAVPLTYFYPGNRKDSLAVARCEAGRVGSRLRQVSLGSKRDSAWMRRWVDGLLESGGWGIAMTHGIVTGYDALGDPSRLWSHLDYVASLRDSLWVATLADVTAYVKERDAVALSVAVGPGGVTVMPRYALDSLVFRHPLTLVVPASGPVVATQGGPQAPGEGERRARPGRLYALRWTCHVALPRQEAVSRQGAASGGGGFQEC